MNSFNLADMFVALGARFRNRPAVVTDQRTLSYAELVARAGSSAHELRSRGVLPGSNVGIAVQESSDFLVLMVGVWMLGATAVPIDFRTRTNERKSLSDEFDLFSILEHRAPPENAGYSSILIDEAWDSAVGRQANAPLYTPSESRPALIAPTSGTSGRPVGMVLSHERLLHRLVVTLNAGNRKPGGRMLNALSISYAAPRNFVLSELMGGGTVHFYPPLFSADELTEAMLTIDATALFGVPTVIRDMLEIHGERSSPIFPKVNLLCCGGAPLSGEDKLRAKTALCDDFFEQYSSSISGRISELIGEDLLTRPETVGRVLPHVNLEIVDHAGEPVAAGTSGVIRVRSPTMASAIYGDVNRAAGDRLKDGWAYTGDVGAVDEEGFLTLHGREADTIVRGGVNIHPSEIEATIATIAGVREAAVVGFASVREGEEIAAFIVTDGTLSEAKISAELRSKLAPDRCPRKVIIVDSLPRNANGKVVRADLRAKLGEVG